MAMSPRLLVPRASRALGLPKTIAGLELWLDAADAGNVVTTGSPARVSSWRDKSGFGRHAVNSAAGATQPLYVAAARNGNNAVRFSSSDNTLLTIENSTAAFNFLHNGTSSFIAFACTFGDTANPAAAYGLFSNFNSTPGAGPGTAFYYEDRGAANDGLRFFTDNGTNYSINTQSDNVLTANTLLVVTMRIDADNATASQRSFWSVNGAAEVNNSAQANAATNNNAISNMLIGQLVQFGLSMTGDFCELLFYSQTPSATDRQRIYDYLVAKWQ